VRPTAVGSEARATCNTTKIDVSALTAPEAKRSDRPEPAQRALGRLMRHQLRTIPY